MNQSDQKAATAVREAAAEWVVRLGSAGATRGDHAELLAWLRRSPLHLKAYLLAESDWAALDDAASVDTSDIQALIARGPDNIVGLDPKHRNDTEMPNKRATFLPRRPWRLAAAAAAVALLIAGGALVPRWVESMHSDLYSTGIGEQRRIVLADGSAIELNTQTQLRVRFDSTQRIVEFRKGEAFFSVAKDTARPFRVRSDTAVVQALGTQFNVYEHAGRTDVTVIEGRVAVASLDGDAVSASKPVEAGAGSSVQIKTESRPTVAATRSDAPVAWRERRLVFENESLTAVIAEFNRYNAKQLIVGDAALGARRVSGTFDPNAPRDLVDFLTQHDEVRAEEFAGSIVLSVPAKSSER